MAIQLPDVGTGVPADQTGDSPWLAMKKVRENFSDQTNAASKLVGATAGRVPLSENVIEAYLTNVSFFSKLSYSSIDDLPAGTKILVKVADNQVLPISGYEWLVTTELHGGGITDRRQLAWSNPFSRKSFLYVRHYFVRDKVWSDWYAFYTSENTTKDTATGFLKASSPVLHVYNDSITKIHEAEQLDITVDKKGVGHYEIHGTTGLRKNDGWFMSPPRDVHGNVLCMVDLEEKDGVVILRTYKKKFDFETVSIVHDYDNPMDIPEGVCVEFRFNDLPLDDTQMEV